MKEKEKSITLGDIIHVLWKNIILLGVITVVITLIGVVYTFGIAKPTYTSSASVIVAVPTNSGVDNVDYANSIRATVTVADSIKENSILGPVVEKYNSEFETQKSVYIPGTTTLMSLVDKKKTTVEDLASSVSVNYTTNAFKITITVSNKNAELAQYFAAAIQEEVISEAKDDGVFFFAADSMSASSHAELGEYAKPNKKLYLIVAFLLGLVLGCVVIFVKEFMSNKFKTKAEIEAAFDDKIIGVFPDHKDKNCKSNSKDVHLLELTVRNMEPYNKLLSNIKYSNVENPNRVIEVTSTIPDELKSTTAANLAYCIANNNQKVIIIDCDIRKAVLHKTFGVEREKGIVEYSASEVTKEEVIKHTQYGVDIITAGRDVINPVAILESTKVKELVKELKEEYDYVILDVPPALACSDPQIVSTYVDGVIYTIAINQSKKKDIIDSLSNLKNIDANIIGLSITKAEVSKKDSYYYYYNDSK